MSNFPFPPRARRFKPWAFKDWESQVGNYFEYPISSRVSEIGPYWERVKLINVSLESIRIQDDVGNSFPLKLSEEIALRQLNGEPCGIYEEVH